jgi:nitrile hydratase subunit beta
VNGPHDLGGMQAFGAVTREATEPVFAAAWEGRAFAMILALLGSGRVKGEWHRFAMERLPPALYYRATYYERRLWTLQANVIETGIASRAEIEGRMKQLADGQAPPAAAPGPPAHPIDFLAGGAFGTRRPAGGPPRFAPGAPVRTRNMHPQGHTRLPRYLRGKRGLIARVSPACVFPDSNAANEGEEPQHVYSVRFEAQELWGDSAEPNTVIHADLWESYLEVFT